jgi:hypothetical protein
VSHEAPPHAEAKRRYPMHVSRPNSISHSGARESHS